jgi:hypothetical protein
MGKFPKHKRFQAISRVKTPDSWVCDQYSYTDLHAQKDLALEV